mgnify:FL=1
MSEEQGFWLPWSVEEFEDHLSFFIKRYLRARPKIVYPHFSGDREVRVQKAAFASMPLTRDDYLTKLSHSGKAPTSTVLGESVLTTNNEHWWYEAIIMQALHGVAMPIDMLERLANTLRSYQVQAVVQEPKGPELPVNFALIYTLANVSTHQINVDIRADLMGMGSEFCIQLAAEYARLTNQADTKPPAKKKQPEPAVSNSLPPKQQGLDGADQKIIDLLVGDPDMKTADIALAIGLSYERTRKRRAALARTGKIPEGKRGPKKGN